MTNYRNNCEIDHNNGQGLAGESFSGFVEGGEGLEEYNGHCII